MSDYKEKRFVRGNVKEKQFAEGSPLYNISINIDKFLSKEDGAIAQFADDSGWVQLTIQAKKGGKDQYGNTHSISLNEWKPDENFQPKVGNDAPASPADDEGDLPF